MIRVGKYTCEFVSINDKVIKINFHSSVTFDSMFGVLVLFLTAIIHATRFSKYDGACKIE